MPTLENVPPKMAMNSMEMFPATSDPSMLSNLSIVTRPEEEHGLIENIRLTPATMVFANAYEGKTFEQKLVIQNIGKTLAFVRLCPPTAQAFKVKAFRRGHYLSPGLKIVRTISYTYTRTLAVPQAYMPISINGTWINYTFQVTLSAAVITLKPQQLDFGRIDAVNAATTRTLVIQNSGYKGTNFAIDLGRNELQIIVDPMKGNVHAKSSVTLRVELSGSTEGDFMEEFWIKTSPPQRVVVTGTFISPKLMVRSFYHSLDFSIVDFPRTYYGARYTKPLMIKNCSSSNSIFYVMAEIHGKRMSLPEAREKDENYANFFLQPYDGRMYAEKGSVVQITFTPTKSKLSKREPSYFACFLKIIRMQCRDITPGALDDADVTYDEKSIRESVIILPPTSENYLMPDSVGFNPDAQPRAKLSDIESSIRVCLHGEKEVARISLRPDLLILNDLELHQVYERELFVQNESAFLPITVKYLKIPSVNVIPSEFTLEPKGSAEVKITIRPAKLVAISTKIAFDLLHPDFPNERNQVRKVGSAMLKLEFSTTLLGKKSGAGKPQAVEKKLVDYLEEDRPEEIRKYQLTEAELEKKAATKLYYLEFFRKNAAYREKLRKQSLIKAETDYDLTNKKLLRRQNVKLEGCKEKPEAIIKPISPFIPLAPKQLYNIKIFPTFIRLKRVAAFTSIKESFTLTNMNDFPIRVFLRPSKLCVNFCGEYRQLIEGNETRKISFVFSSFSVGKYNITIEVIVNESHVFQVASIAEVTPKTIMLNVNQVEFNEKDDNFKFIELRNTINAATSYDWDVQMSCFDIYPLSGRVPPERTLMCMVSYSPDPRHPDTTECSLNSESGLKQMVQLSHNKFRHSVAFDCYEIDAGVIPLNTPVVKKAIMKNLGNDPVPYTIEESEPFPGVKIFPTQGMLPGRDNEIFYISMQFKAAIAFTTYIKFIIQEREEIEIMVSGAVEFPNIVLQPDCLQMRRIAPYSFDRKVFKIKNLSSYECHVSFPMEGFPEFTITNSETLHFPHQGELLLEPKESKVLFLHFHPCYVSTYAFYFPLIINGLVGPSHISDNKSIKTRHFTDPYLELYENMESATIIENIPISMPLMRVTCCAVEKSMEFSSLEIRLTYFGDDHYNNKTEADFIIFNTSEEAIDVCIRTDGLYDPLALAPKSVDNLECYDVSYKFEIEAGQRAVFEASFYPRQLGRYVIQLPIFLRNYEDNKIFNYLTLEGVYRPPAIVPSQEILYFQPVPMKVKNENCLILTLSDHRENCTMSSETDVKNLWAVFQGGRETKIQNGQITVALSITVYSSICFDSEVTFSCSCGSSCRVLVKGISENCVLTCYSALDSIKTFYDENDEQRVPFIPAALSDMEISSTSVLPKTFYDQFVNTNETCFPFFPKEDDVSPYAVHIRKVLKNVESWVYTQGFFKKKFYRIPEGFTECSLEEELTKKPAAYSTNKTKKVEMPLVQLLLNLGGGGLRTHLVTSEAKSYGENDQMAYFYSVYANALSLLRGFNAYLPQVKAKFLLNYDQYLLYKKYREEKCEEYFDRENYYLYSKQCWMDLILQTIKVLVLCRIDTPKVCIERPSKLKRQLSLNSADISMEERPPADMGVYNDNEMILIGWLQTHFEEHKATLWKNSNLTLKELNLFDNDLKDGLFLGAVTASYCPYIRHLIEDMFAEPESEEEVFHNACKLVQSWKALKLSIDVHPFRIISPCMVDMLLLVTYLYDVLPHCQPKEVITIETPLTKRSHAEMELTNCSDTTVVYEVLFFQNDHKLFEVAESLIRVPPKKTTRFKIVYFAKHITKVSAFLLLSGESPGQKYAKSVAVKLVGIPDVSYVNLEISLVANMYQPREISLNLESPFKIAARYERFVSFKPASDKKDMLSFDALMQMKIPKLILFRRKHSDFDEQGKRESRPILCCMIPGQKEIWLYYVNQVVGDFAIKINITAKASKKNHEVLEVALPKNFDRHACTCKNGPDLMRCCPKLLKIDIPSQNNLLWQARRVMLLQNVEESEQEFWKKTLATAAGSRIIKLIMESEMEHVIGGTEFEPRQYDIVLEPNCPFVTASSIRIEDATSEDCVELLLHATRSLSDERPFLQLNSTDMREVRFYKLVFKESE